MQVSTKAFVTIARPRAEVFDALIRDEAFVAFCQRLGPFAAIAKSTTHGEPRAGVRRSIEMSDGLKLEETIAEHDPPNRHAYGWTDPAMPLGALLRRADAVWSFEDGGEETHVTWRYTFTLRSPLLWPLGKLVSSGFRRWMLAGLERAKASLD